MGLSHIAAPVNVQFSADGQMLKTFTRDYGHVRLHNYPSTDPKTCHAYGGHAEFVVGVEFLRDDSQLISCGGADMAIFQWKLYKKKRKGDQGLVVVEENGGGQ